LIYASAKGHANIFACLLSAYQVDVDAREHEGSPALIAYAGKHPLKGTRASGLPRRGHQPYRQLGPNPIFEGLMCQTLPHWHCVVASHKFSGNCFLTKARTGLRKTPEVGPAIYLTKKRQWEIKKRRIKHLQHEIRFFETRQ
jgi:hypothetical protein